MIIAYGAIGATVVGILGPVFIPWMVFDKTEFLFWGWLKAFLGFEFYKVVAAATMSVMSHLLISYLTSGAMNVEAPEELVDANACVSHAVLRGRLCPSQDSHDDCQPLLRPYRWSCQRGWGVWSRPYFSGTVKAMEITMSMKKYNLKSSVQRKNTRTVRRSAGHEHVPEDHGPGAGRGLPCTSVPCTRARLRSGVSIQ